MLLKPVQPDEPVPPEEPVQPVEPVQPDEPVPPEEPVQPGKLVPPPEPVQPGKGVVYIIGVEWPAGTKKHISSLQRCPSEKKQYYVVPKKNHQSEYTLRKKTGLLWSKHEVSGLQRTIYVKNCEFIKGCKANNDTHKTTKLLLTFNISGHIALLFIYAIRPWPYMRIPAWSQWSYISDSFAIHSKAYGLCSILQQYQTYVKCLFRSRHKTLKHHRPSALARQSWYKSHCWWSTTVSDRVERLHNRTALIKLILNSKLGYSSVVLVTLCNNKGGYTRPLVTARLRQYTAVRGSESAHAAWTIELL